jgi:hypothetical protein
MSGLGAVIHQESGVLSALTHIDGSKVQRALDATTFIENDREGLLNTGSAHFHDFALFLA